MDIKSTASTIPTAAPAPQRNVPSTAYDIPAAAEPAPVEIASAVQQADPATNLREVAQAVRNLNKAMQEQSQGLEFSIDTDSKRTVVKVVDQDTKEVLRQIPSEDALKIAKALDQMKGLLIQQKA